MNWFFSVTIEKIGNFKFIRKKEFVVPLKHGTKKISFFMKYSRLFLKYGLEENHWVGHSVMKPVDVVAFQKKKAHRES